MKPNRSFLSPATTGTRSAQRAAALLLVLTLLQGLAPYPLLAQTAPAPATTTPTEAPVASGPLNPDELVEAQFPNVPVSAVIDWYQAESGKRILRDATLPQQNITLEITERIPRKKALELVESLLLLNGFAIVPTEDADTVKLLPFAKNPRGHDIPLFANANDLPANETIVSFYMPLKYIDPADAQTMFSAYIQQNPFAAFVQVKKAQALVITETSTNIRRLIDLAKLIDVPDARIKSDWVKLTRADVTKVADAVTKIIDARKPQNPTAAGNPAAQQGQPANAAANAAANASQVALPTQDAADSGDLGKGDVKLFPDPRTNRILVTARPSVFEAVRQLILDYDVAVELVEPLEMPLKYVAARDILPTLASLLDDSENASGANGAANANSANGSQNNNSNFGNLGGNSRNSGNSFGNSGSGSGSSSSSSFSQPDVLIEAKDTTPQSITIGKIRLLADNRSNIILVSGPAEAVEKARLIIDKLDRRPLQVYLATVIGQLTLGDNFELGVDYLQKYQKLLGNSENGYASSLFARGGPATVARTLVRNAAFPTVQGYSMYGTFGTTLEAYVKALETSNRFKILSRPVIYTSNGQKAVISTGEDVPVPTTTQASVLSGTNSSALNSTISFKEVALKLEVIPLINSRKEVTLQIAQNNDTVAGSINISGNNIPRIAKQQIRTTITVSNLQTVVLGGLIKEQDQKDTTGFPGLSKIPVLGYLFRKTETQKQRNELIFIMQPRVIDGVEDFVQANEMEYQRAAGVGDQTLQMALPPEDNPKIRKEGKF